MAGKVKITVIATGFERPNMSQSKPAAPAATNTPTPVDLSSYASWKQDAGERPPVPAQPGCRCRRRSILEIPAAGTRGANRGEPPSAGTESEPVSPLDVPAFLRRQTEG